MGAAVDLALVLGALVLIGLMATRLYNTYVRSRVAADRWRLVEESDGELLSVYAALPGHADSERILVGAVPCAASDFEYRIEEVRSEGRMKLAALNSGRG